MANTKPNNDAGQKGGKQASGNENKGFASMPTEKVQEIASKGGHASAEKAGHEGMAERGRKGGEARAEQLGSEGYSEIGQKGGGSNKGSQTDDSGEDDENETE